MTPNEAAIRRVLADCSLVLVGVLPKSFRAFPRELVIAGPCFTHDALSALLDGFAETEWEAWIEWCFSQDRGKCRPLKGLVARRGRVYVE